MRFVFKTSYDADIRLFKHQPQAFWYLLLLVMAVALPYLISDYLLGEMTLVLIWSICAMGLMLLIGQSGQVSLGHAAFMAVGAYSNVIYQTHFNLPFLLSFPLAGITAGLVGAILAHSCRAGDLVLKKGHVLSAEDIQKLQDAGAATVTIAQLEDGDIGEDEAARRCAAVITGDDLAPAAAATGRVNIHAQNAKGGLR